MHLQPYLNDVADRLLDEEVCSTMKFIWNKSQTKHFHLGYFSNLSGQIFEDFSKRRNIFVINTTTTQGNNTSV